MSRVGLVATFRFVPFIPREGGQEATDTFERCWSTLESFVLFHLSKGVEHVFLYADDDRGSNDVYIGESTRKWSDGSKRPRPMPTGAALYLRGCRSLRIISSRISFVFDFFHHFAETNTSARQATW